MSLVKVRDFIALHQNIKTNKEEDFGSETISNHVVDYTIGNGF